jgi:hypothetical protein
MNGRPVFGALVVLALALVAVPILLSGMFSTWRSNQQAAQRVVVAPVHRPPPAAPPTPAPVEPQIEPVLRPVDEAAMSAVEIPVEGTVLEDATPDQPFRIRVVRHAETSARALYIDLDRDGNFDERWTAGAPMRRSVSPADDGVFTQNEVWTAAGWQPAPTAP